jgi:hypothetical protein
MAEKTDGWPYPEIQELADAFRHTSQETIDKFMWEMQQVSVHNLFLTIINLREHILWYRTIIVNAYPKMERELPEDDLRYYLDLLKVPAIHQEQSDKQIRPRA